MSPPATTEDFLTLIVKSGLIPRAQLDDHVRRWREQSEDVDDSQRLALLCVRDRVLTRYQVANLRRGKWKNFIIGAKYKLLDLIGSGGMGQVFLCEHVLMRRRVALKVLPTRKMVTPAALDRFLREAQAIASLDHPNIVRAFDLDRDGAAYFLVLEYVDGVSMQQLVGHVGPLEPDQAAHYIAQAASGLQHAHEAGWVHRDIKPNNLLLDRQGVVKILDLGLARLRDDEAESMTGKYEGKSILGTADYLAPEQALDSHNVDIRADIYGLGATLYFLLTGKPPFAGGTLAEKFDWLQHRTPTPIRDLRPDVPRELALVLERMMARDRNRRYATPAAVVEALMPLVRDTGPFPPPATILPASVGARGDRYDAVVQRQREFARAVRRARQHPAIEPLGSEPPIESAAQAVGGRRAARPDAHCGRRLGLFFFFPGSFWADKVFPPAPQIGEPIIDRGVGRHAPVAARRQADRADLRAVRQARALELVREESPQKHAEPVANSIGRIIAVELRMLGEEQDLLRRRR